MSFKIKKIIYKELNWRPCPGVLGGCGGAGRVRGNEVLCPKCLKLASG